MTSMILLGAGASYGSEPSGNAPVPPLGTSLFESLEKGGFITMPIPEDIKKLFRINFETGMAAYSEYVNGNISKLQCQIAKYLAGFQPTKDNLYIRLISELRYKKIIFSSLNYDLLLEQSASKVGLGCFYSAEKFATVSPNPYIRLLKIHGSSNVWPDTGSNIFENNNFYNVETHIETAVTCLTQQQTLERCSKETSFFPVMAVYTNGKPVKICPNFIKEQQAMWRKSINKARKIIISGVKIHEPDEHIWSVLGKSSIPVIYFGLDADYGPFQEWKNKYPKKQARFIKGRFQEFVSTVKSLT